jgi:two-component system, NarL family, response regulator LiaR
MSEKISVVLVDDHAVVRQGIKTYLSLQPDLEVIGVAASGEESIQCVNDLVPDVVLMDLIMPGGIDGVEATRRIREISPRTQVIVLTSYHDDEHIFPAIRAGALSYLLKDVDAADLADAIRKAAVNQAVLHPRVAARVVQELHGTRLDETNPFTVLSRQKQSTTSGSGCNMRLYRKKEYDKTP